MKESWEDVSLWNFGGRMKSDGMQMRATEEKAKRKTAGGNQ